MSATGAREASPEILVANSSDEINGDVSSVDALLADPGPDGVSLREAIEATNNDPGSRTIRFDGALAGATIRVTGDPGLPQLLGGGVTIDGDIDGDGDPDVTIRGDPESPGHNPGFHIASGGNHLHALALTGFGVGVELSQAATPDGPPTNVTFSDNTIDGLVMRRIQGKVVMGEVRGKGVGILIGSFFCEPPGACETYNTWANTTITNNTIEATSAGIKTFISGTGDRVDGATITDNVIRVAGHLAGKYADVAIGLEAGGDADGVGISDVLIARNSIEGEPSPGIHITAGTDRAQGVTTQRVRVVDNRLHLVKQASGFCCVGIVVNAGSDDPSLAVGPPVRYLDDNLVRDVVVRGNVVTGTLEGGASVIAGSGGGGRRNRVEDVTVVRNVFRSSAPMLGVSVSTGGGQPYGDRCARDNEISGLTIRANRIRIGTGPEFVDAGGGVGAAGIALVGGAEFSRRDVVRDIEVQSNRIRTAYVGIKLIGGKGSTARRNRVIACVRGNTITGTQTTVSVRSNVDGASGNRASLRC